MVLKHTDQKGKGVTDVIRNTVGVSADTTNITVDFSHLVDFDHVSVSVRISQSFFLSKFVDSVSILSNGEVQPTNILGPTLENTNTFFNALTSMLVLSGGLFDPDNLFAGNLLGGVVAGDNQPQFIFGPEFVNTQNILNSSVNHVLAAEYDGVSAEYNSTATNYGS